MTSSWGMHHRAVIVAPVTPHVMMHVWLEVAVTGASEGSGTANEGLASVSIGPADVSVPHMHAGRSIGRESVSVGGDGHRKNRGKRGNGHEFRHHGLSLHLLMVGRVARRHRSGYCEECSGNPLAFSF